MSACPFLVKDDQVEIAEAVPLTSPRPKQIVHVLGLCFHLSEWELSQA